MVNAGYFSVPSLVEGESTLMGELVAPELAMDISSDAQFWLTVACAITMIVGLVGVIVPVLPGLPVCFLAVLVWAIFVADGGARWVIVIIAAIWMILGEVMTYLWPGKHLVKSGVPKRSVLVGGLAGLVGFFVIPVIGLPIGFVLGVWGMETYRFKDAKLAWPPTQKALVAVGLSILVELAFGLLILATWVTGLLLN